MLLNVVLLDISLMQKTIKIQSMFIACIIFIFKFLINKFYRSITNIPLGFRINRPSLPFKSNTRFFYSKTDRLLYIKSTKKIDSPNVWIELFVPYNWKYNKTLI